MRRVQRAGRAAVTNGDVHLDSDEIHERMNGNQCRCGAYANLVPAILTTPLEPFSQESRATRA